MSDERELRIVQFLVEPPPAEDALVRAREESVALDPAFEDRLVESAVCAWQEKESAPLRIGSQIGAGAVLPFRKRPSKRAVAVLGGLSAMAAAATIALLLGQDTRYPALPPYTSKLETIGQHLGGPEAGAHLAAGRSLEIDVRPDDEVSGPVAIRAYLGASPRLVRWPVEFERRGRGRFHLVAPASTLPVSAPGTYPLVIFVGRPDALPSDEEAARLAAGQGAVAPPSLVMVRDFVILDSK